MYKSLNKFVLMSIKLTASLKLSFFWMLIFLLKVLFIFSDFFVSSIPIKFLLWNTALFLALSVFLNSKEWLRSIWLLKMLTSEKSFSTACDVWTFHSCTISNMFVQMMMKITSLCNNKIAILKRALELVTWFHIQMNSEYMWFKWHIFIKWRTTIFVFTMKYNIFDISVYIKVKIVFLNCLKLNITNTAQHFHKFKTFTLRLMLQNTCDKAKFRQIIFDIEILWILILTKQMTIKSFI